MISVIICSVNPKLLEQIKLNISSTIGVEHEFVVYDNRIDKCGINKVYNLCARRSKYDYCCFVHEDVIFDTDNWGKILIDFYQKNSLAGVTGFAGSKIALRNFISWRTNTIFDRYNYYECLTGAETYKHIAFNPDKELFSRVVVLDGFFLFVKKSIVFEKPFDENTFKGFHMYDADFSLSISEKYRNYVNHNIKAKHLSKGSYDINYFGSLMLFHGKRSSKIYYSDDVIYSRYEFFKTEMRLAFVLLKCLYKRYGLLFALLYIVKFNFINFVMASFAFISFILYCIRKYLIDIKNNKFAN